MEGLTFPCARRSNAASAGRSFVWMDRNMAGHQKRGATQKRGNVRNAQKPLGSAWQTRRSESDDDAVSAKLGGSAANIHQDGRAGLIGLLMERAIHGMTTSNWRLSSSRGAEEELHKTEGNVLAEKARKKPESLGVSARVLMLQSGVGRHGNVFLSTTNFARPLETLTPPRPSADPIRRRLLSRLARCVSHALLLVPHVFACGGTARQLQAERPK